MKKYITLLIVALCPIVASSTVRKVLFIGNSYTATNNLPKVIEEIAQSMGDTLVYDEYSPGGQKFQAHSTDPTVASKINSQKWDIVVLQAQSQEPSFPPAQVASETYPYAKKLDSMILKNNSCTETMFFMTWGRQNGDASNCANYPVICTYEGMQMRLRESYLQMAQDNSAIVAPVGSAWKQIRDSFTSINLYSSDGSHPSFDGTYLAACVFYASIFHRSPEKSTYTGSVTTANANVIKRIAAKTVLDSFMNWNKYGNYTYAKFTKTISGSTINLTNQSVYSSNNMWAYGNAVTSTTVSPVYTYPAKGKYIITLTASNTCFTETAKDSINLLSNQIQIQTIKSDLLKVGAGHEGNIVIRNQSDKDGVITFYNEIGVKLTDIKVPANNTIEYKSPVLGLYVYSFIQSGLIVSRGKVIINELGY